MEKTMEKQGTAVHEQTKLLVMTGLFIALGYVATTVLMVPSPTGGYMNLGDTVVLFAQQVAGRMHERRKGLGGVGRAEHRLERLVVDLDERLCLLQSLRVLFRLHKLCNL